MLFLKLGSNLTSQYGRWSSRGVKKEQLLQNSTYTFFMKKYSTHVISWKHTHWRFGNWRQGTVAWQLIWLPFFQVSHAHFDMLHNNVSLLCSLTQWEKKRGMGAGKLQKFMSFFSGKKVQDSSSKAGWNISIPEFYSCSSWLAECAYTSILLYLLVCKMTLIIPASQRHTENSLRTERFSNERCSGSAGVCTYSFLVLQTLLSHGL